MYILLVALAVVEAKTSHERFPWASEFAMAPRQGKERIMPRLQASGVGQVHRIVRNIRVKVDAALKLNGILVYEPTGACIQIARPVKIQVRLWVELARGVLERIRQRAG